MDQWSPELRRALVRVRAEFFGWTSEHRLRYHAALPDDDRAAMVDFLVAATAGTDAAADLARQEREGRLPLDLQNRVNELLLPPVVP